MLVSYLMGMPKGEEEWETVSPEEISRLGLTLHEAAEGTTTHALNTEI